MVPVLLGLLTCLGCAAGRKLSLPDPPGGESAASGVPGAADTASPTAEQPVQASINCRRVPSAAKATWEVVVDVRIAEDHYLHAPDEKHPDFIPLVANITLPQGGQVLGEWQYSEPQVEHDLPVFRDRVQLRQHIEIAGDVAPASVIPVQLSYQACTSTLCSPPASLQLSANLGE